jgi:CBS domain containing-hemolysin-like protein
MNTVMLVVLASLALVSVSLLKTYRHVSLRELKRRAREGDELAAALYVAVAYGHTLGAVLWFLVGVTNALFFVWVARTTPPWFAVVVSAALLWYAFVWMPSRDVTRFSTWLAVRLAPILAKLMNYLHPVVEHVTKFIDAHKPITVHTGLYDREDLLHLIQDQAIQPDSRIERVELEVAFHALTFGDHLVRDVMTPRRVVKMVAAEAEIGPILMSELHDSGFSRFPVYSGKRDNIAGTLYLRDLVNAKHGGHIEDIMQKHAAFVHEEQPLTDALQAILRTRRHLFVVVNSFEEFVGIITMEDVLERIVGKPIYDEFDEYEDLRAVAARAAKKEHQQHLEAEKSEEKPPEKPEEPTPESTEVVE